MTRDAPYQIAILCDFDPRLIAICPRSTRFQNATSPTADALGRLCERLNRGREGTVRFRQQERSKRSFADRDRLARHALVAGALFAGTVATATTAPT